MRMEVLFDIVCAAHLSTYVKTPWEESGGIIFVAPPGHMKTSILNVLASYPDVALVSDLNNQSLNKMRDRISSNQLRTLAILDLQKLYERHSNVSSNLEGNLRALVEEGYAAGFESPDMNRLKARAVVLAGTTSQMYESKWDGWVDSGFARRFLWSIYKLDNAAALMDSVERWQRLDLGGSHFARPRSGNIPYELTTPDRQWIRELLKHQRVAGTTPFQFMCKVAAVLSWHFKRERRGRWKATLEEFGETLCKDGGLVHLPKQAQLKKRKKRMVTTA